MQNFNPFYITGLAEGEGSFYVGILPRNLDKIGWEVRPSFSLSQNKRNKKVIFGMKEFFGCGWIRPSKRDQTLKYEVRSLEELSKRVIPHFENFPLRGEKKKDFETFKRIVGLMKRGNHLEKEGLKEIIELVRQMTRNPKRIHSLKKIAALLKV